MCLCVCVVVRRQLVGVGFLPHHGIPRTKCRLTGLLASTFALSHHATHCFTLGCYHLNAGGGICFSFLWKLRYRPAIGGLNPAHTPLSPHLPSALQGVMTSEVPPPTPTFFFREKVRRAYF